MAESLPTSTKPRRTRRQSMTSPPSLSEEVQCCLCLNVLNDPVSTPCGHNFCRICLKQCWDNSQIYSCPYCKETFSKRPELNINTTLREVTMIFKEKFSLKGSEVLCDVCDERKLKALKCCLMCQKSYCETHLEPHQRVLNLKKHKLMDPVENIKDYICEKHERPLELFCRDDQTRVCVFCTEGDHKNHNTVPLEEESKEKKFKPWPSQDPEVLEALKASREPTLEKAKASEKFDQLFNVSLNIAVTGMTGSGKSTFVNALRGLDDDDEGASPTGPTETTMEAIMYEHPGMPNVNIWELPGTGSPIFKMKNYLDDVKFDIYDFFIILSSVKFTEIDMMLAKEIKKRKKNFYFVRSKIDVDIYSEQRRKGFDEQKVLSKIREDCEKNLREMENPAIFLISSFDLEKYDFDKLRKTLEEELPTHKRSALLQAWPVCSAESLEEKIKYYEGFIWSASFVSGGIAMVPVPSLSVACDAGIVSLFFVRCYYAFGLDEASLTRLSKKVNVDLTEYLRKSKIASAIRDKTMTRIGVSASLALVGTAEYMLSLIPGVGSVAAAGLSFGTTYYLLRQGLNELANIAREIRKVAGVDAVC